VKLGVADKAEEKELDLAAREILDKNPIIERHLGKNYLKN